MTPARPGTAWSAWSRPPARCWPAGSPRSADRRVHLRSYAFVGARSSDLVGPDRPRPPDRAARRRDPDRRQRRHPQRAALPVRPTSLRGRPPAAATPASRSWSGTCPDLGTVKPIAPPLQQVGRAWSHRLAAAQTIAVVEQGGRTVSLASILGPEFEAASALLFGPDRFHPSTARLPEAGRGDAALGAGRARPGAPDEALPEAYRGEGVLPVTAAAIQAVKTPGTEVDGTEVAGARRGVRGLWVELRHRRQTAVLRDRGAHRRGGRRPDRGVRRRRADALENRSAAATGRSSAQYPPRSAESLSGQSGVSSFDISTLGHAPRQTLGLSFRAGRGAH